MTLFFANVLDAQSKPVQEIVYKAINTQRSELALFPRLRSRVKERPVSLTRYRHSFFQGSHVRCSWWQQWGVMCSIANCGGGAPESLVLVWDIPQNKSKVEVQLTQRWNQWHFDTLDNFTKTLEWLHVLHLSVGTQRKWRCNQHLYLFPLSFWQLLVELLELWGLFGKENFIGPSR